MSYRLIEGCCGSAALTLHLCGANKSIITYQGSKWKYRTALAEILSNKGFVGLPDEIELYDPGPWSKVIPLVFTSKDEIVDELKFYSKFDPKFIYHKFQNQPCSKIPANYAAEFLFLQRLAFSGKAVGSSSGVWKSPGFNTTSAYGLEGTDKFGPIKPMLPGMIKTLSKLSLTPVVIVSGNTLSMPIDNVQNTVVYLDPPYQDSTKYPDGDLSRQEVVDLALAWHQAGATVLVSEAEPLSELNSWNQVCISSSKQTKNSFRSKKEEWVMVSP